jgi:chromosome segregation ATPase
LERVRADYELAKQQLDRLEGDNYQAQVAALKDQLLTTDH